MSDWKRLPESEISRLENTLVNHLREMEIKKTKNERHEFVDAKIKNVSSLIEFYS